MAYDWGQWHWFDLVLLLIIVRGGYRGFQLGFARAFFGLVGLVVAFPLAGLLTPGVADFVERQWQASERVAAFMADRIALPAGLTEVDLRSISTVQLLEQLKMLKLPAAYIDTLGNMFDELVAAASSQGAQTVGEFLFYAMGIILVNTVVFLLLVSLVRALFDVMARGFTRRMGIGVIGLFNRVAGFAFSTVTTTIGLMVFLGLLSPLLGLGSLAFLNNIISHSALAGWLLKGFYLISPWIVRTGQQLVN